MTSAPDAFGMAASTLEQQTRLTGPQARGCLRLALKDGGLSVREVTPQQLAVVFRRLMPRRLEAQGVTPAESAQLCHTIAEQLEALDSSTATDTAASMFERLDRER